MTDTITAAYPETEAVISARVGRELVHRRAVSEVFLLGLERCSDTEFTVFAQWPRWHVFYGARDGSTDSAMIVETLRQLTVLIAHAGLGVPLGHQFLMPRMALALSSDARLDPSVPADVTINARISGVKPSQQGPGAFDITADFHAGDLFIATGEASARIVDPAVYGRYRKGRVPGAVPSPHEPVAADLVGHASSWNVVLGSDGGGVRWPLRVDLSNPILFDHPLDHVPGVLLIEAVRQALRLATGEPALDFDWFQSTFISVAELDAETEIVIESLTDDAGDIHALVSAQSEGKILMRTTACFRRKRPVDVGAAVLKQVQQALPDLPWNLHA
ncbi:ScbA/BarX family gamma-butyrolactone biosynthesis protein [Micrococcaceae bacterium Sec5.1]